MPQNLNLLLTYLGMETESCCKKAHRCVGSALTAIARQRANSEEIFLECFSS